MKKLPKIGQRVVVKDNITDISQKQDLLDYIIGQEGTVVDTDTTSLNELTVLVSFDTIFSKNLHNGQGISQVDNCWWVRHEALKKLK